MICVQNFTKRYGSRDVVKNISFTAKDGAITGFNGHNGAADNMSCAKRNMIRPSVSGTVCGIMNMR